MSGLGTGIAGVQALTRFGLGARPSDTVPSDPVGWLQAQLAAPDPTPVAGMPTAAQGLALKYAFDKSQPGSSTRNQYGAAINTLFTNEAQAFLTNAVITPAPFRERLVWFWANHFAIMASPLVVASVAGAYVRDAIRPHVTGTFSDMLLAVMSHPAMLWSLNNPESIGPQSQYAQNLVKHGGPQLDINENLGRETLELYTVGIGAGYSQADVDAMAYLFTGWTVNMNTAPQGFVYNPQIAQPGSQTVMGATFQGGTQAGLTQALQALATSPYTYQHLATKLVTHFISDTPAASDVQAVYNALASTGGNLAAAASALIGLPNAWTPLTKLRTPIDLVIAALRAVGATASTVPGNINAMLNGLGQPLWCPPFPIGWSDIGTDWVSPESLLLRMDWAMSFSASQASVVPANVAASSLGPLLSPATTAAMSRVAAPANQLTLMLCSPEFQRR